MQDLDAVVSWIAGRPEKPDLIIYAGDDVERFVPDPETNYFEQLAALSTHGIVAVVGNDDLPEYRNLIGGHKVYEVHSQPVTIGRFLIVGVEGATFLKSGIDLGPTLHTEPEISDHLRRCIPKDTNHTVIVVSHAPPRGCLDEAMRYSKGQIGSTAVREVVERDSRVALVVLGHAHLCGGHDDKLRHAVVLNAASHDNDASIPANVAMLFLHPDGVVEDLRWTKVPSSLPLASEVNGIGRAYAERLAQAGIATVEQLADTSPLAVGEALGRSPKTTAIFVARAQARLKGCPSLVSMPKSSPRGHAFTSISGQICSGHTLGLSAS